MGLLDGKVVLITGGARGQGRAHAVTSAREGAHVVLVDIVEPVSGLNYQTADESDIAETVRQVEALGRRAIPVTGDVRSQRDMDMAVQTALDHFGTLDAVIANAGIWAMGNFWELEEEDFHQMIDINLMGIWRAAKAVAPHMIERGSGSIVVTSSVNGLKPGLSYAHYTSAKHGAVGLMKNIALELSSYGIRCNAVCPGAIDTPMANHQAAWNLYAGNDGGTRDDLISGGYHFHALKAHAFMPPQVIADAGVFLNSELASAITGVALPVDAGNLLLMGFNHNPVRS